MAEKIDELREITPDGARSQKSFGGSGVEQWNPSKYCLRMSAERARGGSEIPFEDLFHGLRAWENEAPVTRQKMLDECGCRLTGARREILAPGGGIGKQMEHATKPLALPT